MDLLIELIVWIFKALLGEDEKTKRRQQDARAAPSCHRSVDRIIMETDEPPRQALQPPAHARRNT